MHWATWAVDLGMLAPSDVSGGVDKSARGMHASAAVPRLYALLQEQSAGCGGAYTGVMAGCERDTQRLSSVTLTYMTRVCLSSHTAATLSVCPREHL